MTHDKNHVSLSVGDKVTIEATVKSITGDSVNLQTHDGSTVTIHACCCEVCDEEDTEETE